MLETESFADTSSIPRSRPISIELHGRRQSGPASTPLEALTARDGLSCGHFASNEDTYHSYETPLIHGHLTSHNHANSSSTEAGPLPTSHSDAVTHPPLSDVSSSMSAGKSDPLVYKHKISPNECDYTSLFSTSLTNELLNSWKKSEARKNLQQYQRDMAQAIPRAGHMHIDRRKLLSPRLSPLNIPEPVTPIVLEESDAYTVTREAREITRTGVRDSGVDNEWPLDPTFEEDNMSLLSESEGTS